MLYKRNEKDLKIWQSGVTCVRLLSCHHCVWNACKYVVCAQITRASTAVQCPTIELS